MRAAAATLAVAVVSIVAGGCGGDESAPPSEREHPAGAPDGRSSKRADERPRVRRARCPAGLADCRTATGRVLYVEAVDADGDGDAHYVLLGGDITFPGVSVIDVRPDLRPPRLPKEGDWVSAAGPVYRGSYGQRQIEALVVHHER